MSTQNTFKRRDVEWSFRKFHDIVSDLFSAQFQQWSDMFTHMIVHCEKDPVMQVITSPLKDDPRVDAKKWWDDAIASVRGRMVGSGYYTLPTDDDERTALLYQVFLGIEYENFNIQRFAQSVYCNSRAQDIVDTFNQELVLKFTREMSYRLEEIVADNKGMDEISREAMIIFHHHDSSTTVHGDVQGIVGDVSNSTVAQDLNMTITKGDFQSLRDYLVESGLTNEDAGELEIAINADPQPSSTDNLGTNVSNWIGKMISKAASGAWEIGVSTAGGLLTNIIWAYYGLG